MFVFYPNWCWGQDVEKKCMHLKMCLFWSTCPYEESKAHFVKKKLVRDLSQTRTDFSLTPRVKDITKPMESIKREGPFSFSRKKFHLRGDIKIPSL